MSTTCRALASSAIAILLAASALTARDEPERICPVCGREAAAFENSPEGVFRKFQAAFVTGDAEMGRECVAGGATGKMSWEMFSKIETFTLLAPLLRMRVVSSKVDADKATLTLGYLGGEPTIEVSAVCSEGTWRLDLGGEDWYVTLGARVMKAVLPAVAKQMDELGDARRRANETTAQACLKQIVSTEGVWRMTDSDRNGAQDYWTLDVAAFYCAKDVNGNELRYVDIAMARADKEAYPRYSKHETAPKSGYWIRAMKTDEEGKPYAQDPDGDGVASTNPSKYGFCAYPAEYGKSARVTFIINEEGVIYTKDLGADAKDGIDAWPQADPTKKGWEECE